MRLHLYCGEGKGKTTAALGQALRAWGWGWEILFVQFLKDARAASGEVKAAAAFGARWRHLRSPLPCSPLVPPPGPLREALARSTAALLERAVRETARGRRRVVVLDEILAAWGLRLLKVADIRRAVAAGRDAGVELMVLTGRRAPRSIAAAADLVTEVRKEKHPYDRGITAVRGIDF